jgi:predicted NUDIX family NTP pyrophosphohydrolase
MARSDPRSAGILLFRERPDIQVLLAHPGGPFWRNRHLGAWSIPKGLVEPGENERGAAIREFVEETGYRVDSDQLIPLGEVRLRSKKVVVGWACRGDMDPGRLDSNPVQLEWPRGSGRTIEFPEIDEVRWCTLEEAAALLNIGQLPFLDRLKEYLDHEE